MALVFYILAAIVFAVKVFGGTISDFDLIALGLLFISLGLLVGGGALSWIQHRGNPN